MKKIIGLFLIMVSLVFAQQVNIPIMLTDNAGGKDTLFFGLDPTATNGIDATLGEQELPPMPPAGVFDIRFVGEDIGIPAMGQGLKKDYRTGTNVSQDSIIHELKYQAGSGTVMVIKWNFPAGVKGYLQDFFGGVLYNKVMTGNDSLVVTNPGIVNKLKMAIKYSLAPTATVTLTAPNGGENWAVGSQQNITWTQTGITTVKLEYTTDNGTNWILIGTAPALVNKVSKRDRHQKSLTDLSEPLGTYPWTVPNTPSTQCKVRVSDNTNATVNDVSNAVFTIATPPPSNWTPQTSGATDDIYTVSVVDANVAWAGLDVGKVLRTTNGGANWTAVTQIPNAYYVNNIKGISATHCLVATIDPSYAGTKIYRTTDGGANWTQVFNQPNGYLDAIHMFDANNGYAYGDPVDALNWTLLKTTDGGASWTSATTLVPETGIYGWGNAMTWVGNTGYFGTNKNKVYKSTDAGATWVGQPTTAMNSYIVDFYDANAGILGSATGSSNMTTNGGTTWSGNIATGGTGSVYGMGSYSTTNFFATSGSNIYATTNGGATWATDFTGTSPLYHLDMKGNSTFAYGYAVGGAGYIVKFLKGTPPPVGTITVSLPNGGENWTVGTSQNITWTSSNVTNVKIEYSTNNGSTYTTVVASIPATPATYAWTVPNTPSTQCLVKISDAGDPTVTDVSNAVFTITAPVVGTIKLINPVGGEVFNNNVNQIAVWKSTDVANVDVYVSSNGGANWLPIATNIPNLNFLPIPPSGLTPGTTYKLKVQQAGVPTVFSASDSNFTLLGPSPVYKDMPIVISDGNFAANLRTGIHPTATDGIDATLGEAELPPIPPTGVFDGRLIGTDIGNPALGQGVAKDFRQGDSTLTGNKTHEIIYQGGQLVNSALNSIKIYWFLPTNVTGLLQGIADTNIKITMTGAGFYEVTNPGIMNKMKVIYSYVGVPSKSVSVTAPNGGENWSVGSVRSINWTASGFTTAKLEYTTDNGTNWILIGTAPALSAPQGNKTSESAYESDEIFGTYSWTIPNTPSTQCKVRVSDNADATTFDVSDNTFTISTAPPGPPLQFSYDINALSAGALALYGAEFDGANFWVSRWSMTFGASQLFKIAKNGASILDSFAVTGFPAASGFRDLAFDGQYLYGAPNSTTIYKVDPVTKSVVSTITAPQAVRGIAYDKARNGLWIANWATSIQLINMSGTVLQTIALTTHGLSQMSGLAYDTLTAGGPYLWVFNGGTATDPKKLFKLNATTGLKVDSFDITNDLPVGAIGGGLFVTKQYQAGTVTLGGVNQGTPHKIFGYQIGTAPVPTVTVTAPNGGENWTVGTNQNITWTSANVTNVKIEYTTDNGTNWIQIVASVPATPATYAWTVPNTPSTNCKVRISDVSDPTVNDLSNAVFTIVAPTKLITVTAPNGGENWLVGAVQNITWTSTNVTNIKIEYTTNNGTTWVQVVATVPATPATYAWTVPNTPSTQCKVKLTEVGGATTDESNALFTIALPKSITVTSPNGGENWVVGSTHPITWTAVNVNKFKVEFTTDNGTNWTVLGYASASPFSWVVPNTLTTQAKVKVTDSTDVTVTDMSNNVFTISLPVLGNFTLVAPVNNARVLLRESNTSTFTVKWNKSTNALTYKFRFNGPTLVEPYIFDVETPDTFLTATEAFLYDRLYTMAVRDSVKGFWDVWAFGGYGQEKRSNSQFGVTFVLIKSTGVPKEGIPTSYDLNQNFPNPFNPSTEIQYQIPKDGFVNITVYSLVGEKVQTIVNEYKKAGYHQTSFNAKDLNSGVYLYVMRVGDYTSTKKMILMK